MKNPDVIEKKWLQTRNHHTQIDLEVTNLPRKKNHVDQCYTLFTHLSTAKF